MTITPTQQDDIKKTMHRICDEAHEDFALFLHAKLMEITKAENIHPSIAMNALISATLACVGQCLDECDRTNDPFSMIGAQEVRLRIPFVKGLLQPIIRVQK